MARLLRLAASLLRLHNRLNSRLQRWSRIQRTHRICWIRPTVRLSLSLMDSLLALDADRRRTTLILDSLKPRR